MTTLLRGIKFGFPLLALLAVACGGSSQPPASPESTTSTTATTVSSPSSSAGATSGASATPAGSSLTAAQKEHLIGHYAPKGGGSGFTLDHTGPTWKVKLDGTDKVYELKVSSESSDWKDYYAAESGKEIVWMQIDNDGTAIRFKGPKQGEVGVEVVRDASGKQL